MPPLPKGVQTERNDKSEFTHLLSTKKHHPKTVLFHYAVKVKSFTVKLSPVVRLPVITAW